MNELVSALLFVAEDLDGRMYPFAGAVRAGARRIAELEATAPKPDTCERCGGPIDRKPRGRRRRFCSERCRKSAANATIDRSQTKESA
jgi:hypothetical protein